MVGQHRFTGKGQKIGHYQDARFYSRLAKGYAFIGIADREPADALGFECARDLHCAVPIRIGFDDGHHFNVAVHGIFDSPKIRRNLSARDLHPGAVRICSPRLFSHSPVTRRRNKISY